jgi:hypothetical protein
VAAVVIPLTTFADTSSATGLAPEFVAGTISVVVSGDAGGAGVGMGLPGVVVSSPTRDRAARVRDHEPRRRGRSDH